MTEPNRRTYRRGVLVGVVAGVVFCALMWLASVVTDHYTREPVYQPGKDFPADWVKPMVDERAYSMAKVTESMHGLVHRAEEVKAFESWCRANGFENGESATANGR